MTLRTQGLWACTMVALLGSGCVLAPGVDPDWATLEIEQDDDRLVYARSRQVETGRNVWIGRAVAGIGAGLALTFVALWHDAEHRHEDGHDVSRAKRQYAWLGGGAGGILLGGVGYAGYHEQVRDDWHLMILDQQARLGELDGGELDTGLDTGPSDAGADQPVDAVKPAPGRPPARILYIEAGSPIPDWATGVEVRTVSGPADAQLADAAKALPALRLPLLVLPGADGGQPTYAMGWTGVRAALEQK